MNGHSRRRNETWDEDDEIATLIPATPPRRRGCTPGKVCFCICGLFFLVPLILILFIALSMEIPLPKRGYPTTYHPHNGTDLYQPALGLYLGPSYATAALAYSNGTVDFLGQVEADHAYVEVLERLQKWSSVHIRPPYYGLLFGPGPWERFRQLHRSTRKKLGLPSTSDVGTLLQPLRPLIALAQERLGYSPQDALLVTLGIRALYDEDVLDILDYIGLEQLPLRHYPWPGPMGCESPHELAAARAGHGFGLCETYWNGTACDEEEAAMPFELLAGVSYSEHAVALSTSGARGADFVESYFVLTDAIGFGVGDEQRRSTEAQNDYWNALASMLSQHISSSASYNYSKLFLYGAGIDEPVASGRTVGDELERIMRAIPGLWTNDMQVLSGDASSVVASGAAKLALRGRFVGRDTDAPSLSSKHELRKRNPDPRGCPWYPADLLSERG